MGNDRSSYLEAQIIRNIVVLTTSFGVDRTDDAKNFAVRRYFPRDRRKSSFRNRRKPSELQGGASPLRGTSIAILLTEAGNAKNQKEEQL
jgi:hypothetical protein